MSQESMSARDFMWFFIISLMLRFQVSSGNAVVRLINGKTNHEGIIQLRHNSTWKTLRYSQWYSKEKGFVICRSLGYSKGQYGSHSLPGNYSTIPYQLICRGYEDNVQQCTKHVLSYAPSTRAAYVTCSNLTQDEMSVNARLVGTSHKNFGIVELLFQGVWRRVCFKHYYWWTNKEARVICRMLGYHSSIGARYFKVSSDIVNFEMIGRRFICGGNESNIMGCTNWNISTNCASDDHHRYAGVMCQETQSPPPFQARLSGSKYPNAGYVEVRFNGIWGTVSEYLGYDYKKKLIQNFVCRQLGYLGYQELFQIYPNRQIPNSYEQLWEFHLSCSDNGSCSPSNVNLTSISRSDDMFVTCKIASPPVFSVTSVCNPVLTIDTTALTEKEKKLITFYEVNVTTDPFTMVTYSSFYIPFNLTRLVLGDGTVYQRGQNRPFSPGVKYFASVRAVYEAKTGNYGFGQYKGKYFTSVACETTTAPPTTHTMGSLSSTSPSPAPTRSAPPVDARQTSSLAPTEIIGISIAAVAILIAVIAIVVYVVKKRNGTTIGKDASGEQLRLNPVADQTA